MTPLPIWDGTGAAVSVCVFAPCVGLCNLLSQYRRTLIRVLFVQNETAFEKAFARFALSRPSEISSIYPRAVPYFWARALILSYFIPLACPLFTAYVFFSFFHFSGGDAHITDASKFCYGLPAL